MGYERVDAYKYDCILYYNSNKDSEDSPVCKESWWKEPKMHDDDTCDITKCKKIPKKVL